MSSWHSYPASFNLGHRAVRDLLTVPHYIEEKVDGSQFSMGLIPPNRISPFFNQSDAPWPCEADFEPVLRIRSKGAEMNVDAPEKMFSEAAETAKRLASAEAITSGAGLHPGWTYRCEYLRVPKHNTLVYDRTPVNHLILFDVNTGDQEWLTREQLNAEGVRLGLDVVPMLRFADGGGTTLEDIRQLLQQTSILGGQKIEGVVVKQQGPNYLYGMDHKTLIGKFVSEQFREAHGIAWKESNPTNGDILLMLGAKYQHAGRWMKAVQHLREAGKLEDSPRDIGKLLIEVQKDLGMEAKEEIKQLLWKWAWPSISRMSTRGVAEWYKERLLVQQFELADNPDVPDDDVPEDPWKDEPWPIAVAGQLGVDMLVDVDPADENDYREPSSADR